MTSQSTAPVRPSIPRKIFGAGWRVLAFVAAFVVASAPIGVYLGVVVQPEGALRDGVQATVDGFGLFAVIAATVVMQKLVDRGRLTDLGLAPIRVAPDLALGVALGAVLLGGEVGALVLGAWARPTGVAFGVDGLTWPALSGVLNVATQDLLLAGYIFFVLRTRFGAAPATVVASLLFTGLHAGALIEGSLIGGVNLFLAGVFLISCLLATGRLWLTLGAHFAWNFVQGPVLGVAVSGQTLADRAPLVELIGPDWIAGGGFGIEGGLAGAAATLAGIAVVWGVKLLSTR